MKLIRLYKSGKTDEPSILQKVEADRDLFVNPDKD